LREVSASGQLCVVNTVIPADVKLARCYGYPRPSQASQSVIEGKERNCAQSPRASALRLQAQAAAGGPGGLGWPGWPGWPGQRVKPPCTAGAQGDGAAPADPITELHEYWTWDGAASHAAVLDGIDRTVRCRAGLRGRCFYSAFVEYHRAVAVWIAV
jgi:hypothetical protein